MYVCFRVQASVHLHSLHVNVCVCTYVYVHFRHEKCIMMYERLDESENSEAHALSASDPCFTIQRI